MWTAVLYNKNVFTCKHLLISVKEGVRKTFKKLIRQVNATDKNRQHKCVLIIIEIARTSLTAEDTCKPQFDK